MGVKLSSKEDKTALDKMMIPMAAELQFKAKLLALLAMEAGEARLQGLRELVEEGKAKSISAKRMAPAQTALQADEERAAREAKLAECQKAAAVDSSEEEAAAKRPSSSSTKRGSKPAGSKRRKAAPSPAARSPTPRTRRTSASRRRRRRSPTRSRRSSLRPPLTRRPRRSPSGSGQSWDRATPTTVARTSRPSPRRAVPRPPRRPRRPRRPRPPRSGARGRPTAPTRTSTRSASRPTTSCSRGTMRW